MNLQRKPDDVPLGYQDMPTLFGRSHKGISQLGASLAYLIAVLVDDWPSRCLNEDNYGVTIEG